MWVNFLTKPVPINKYWNCYKNIRLSLSQYPIGIRVVGDVENNSNFNYKLINFVALSKNMIDCYNCNNHISDVFKLLQYHIFLYEYI